MVALSRVNGEQTFIRTVERTGLIARAWQATRSRAGSNLILVPQDLRTADPSLAAEMALGTFGLAGAIVDILSISPFDAAPPTPAWHDALHSFAWLSDLRAAGNTQARDTALRLVSAWLERYPQPTGSLVRPALMARRLISWLSNAGFLLEGASPAHYDALLAALTSHLHALTVSPLADTAAEDRALVRIATVLGALCLSDQERLLQAELPKLLDELDRQVLADGGHVSRHPGVIVEFLLDLMPLRTCFTARDIAVPNRFVNAIARMLKMLRFMRLGDGSIARFNGMGGTPHDRLAAVLAYDERRDADLTTAPYSRYVRLQRRQSIVLVDAGSPPPLEYTRDSHAGCLAFEMSAGRYPLIVNCGAPGLADQDWRMQGRATASHSTLVLEEQASARLIRAGALVERLGTPLIEGPGRVDVQECTTEDGGAELHGGHDGYAATFGRLHRRSLRLTPQGDRLDGLERLPSVSRLGGGKRRPYAVHFHTHPSSKVTRSKDGSGGEITLPNGECWRLTCDGADMMLEESIYLAHISGPMRSIQLVLRGVADPDTELRWRLERVRSSDARLRRQESQ